MIVGLIARAQSLWRGVRRSSEVDAEMKEEFRLHLEHRAADLVRSGLSPTEATRQARLEFGSEERYRDEGRESRGLRLFDQLGVSWLDFKLGFRMLIKYPGLTLVGGCAIAFAIAVGAATFETVTQMVSPALPLEDGDRIVSIRNWDVARGRPQERALHDFARWRVGLKSVTDLGAFTERRHNLIVGDGGGEPIEVAEISASAFRLARVAPLLGRSLVDTDEQAAAAPVIVIGFDPWQNRFAGDPHVVGRTLRLGAESYTVVGVMPKGFSFPVAHDFWTPLRASSVTIAPNEGPVVTVFGRLVPGASLESAQAELTAIGRRATADFPATHAQLRPMVLPYAQAIFPLPDLGATGLLSINVFFVMLLALVCANVALLMFARAATRETEIAVRTALGASRRRIIGQLFAEALVLGGVAAIVGLFAARFALQWWLGVSAAEADGRLPFWFTDRLSSATVLYAMLLSVLSAVIAGVVPAMKVTGRRVEARLRQASAGGSLRFGGIWTLIIGTQVAVTVAFPATAFFAGRYAHEVQSLDVGFPSSRYLAARLETDEDLGSLSGDGQLASAAGRGRDVDSVSPSADAARARVVSRLHTIYRELEQRLASEPGVAGVTFTDRLPRTQHPLGRIEVDSGGAAPGDSVLGYPVSRAAVAANYFETLGAPILSGRAFNTSDVESAGRVVIVNTSFVHLVLGNRNPIGRRVRYLGYAPGSRDGRPHPWYEIVGVVKDLGMITDDPHNGAGVYHPAALGFAQPTHMVVHVKGDPELFATRLRALAAEVDPALRLQDLMQLDHVGKTMWMELEFLSRLLVIVSAVALLLSLATIYAVMSFTVSRRTREIGVRVALGADAMRVAAVIFARPLVNVGLGVVAGGVLVCLLAFAVSSGTFSLLQVAAIVGYAVVMMGVCMLACVVPTRRALAVQPTEALRADAG